MNKNFAFAALMLMFVAFSSFVADPGLATWSFDVKTAEFGKINYGEKRTQVYTMTNTGTETIEIEIVSGCDCTDIEYPVTVAKPGEKLTITATFNSDRAEEDDFNKELTKDLTIVFKNVHPTSGYPLVEELNFKVHIIK